MRRTMDVEARAVKAFELGRSHEAKGDLEAALRCYAEAADFGHRGAAAVLGVLLASDVVRSCDELIDVWWGDPYALEPAEESWRRAFGGIGAGAARQLGWLLDWDPECVEMEYEVRVAYEAGDPMAGYRLGRILEERGAEVERGYGWRQEADAVYQAVQEQTAHAASAIRRRVGGWWYPDWRLRRVLETGRAPLGIKAHALRAHIYAAVRREDPQWLDKPHWQLDSVIERHVHLRLEWEHAAGETEATYLLGISGLANRKDDARRWLRLAAEAGHAQAAFQLGMYEQAADAGHPGAAFELARRALDAGDRAAAEAFCRKAARRGHVHATALLRILQRSLKVTTRADGVPEDHRIAELLAAWDELSGLAPEPDRCIDYLTGRSGLPRADIERVRRVRNQCAHPADRGWPNPSDVDVALTTATELRRDLLPDSQAQSDVG